jgi:hypothetical protein
MKRIGWMIPLLLVMSSVHAVANSVTYTIPNAVFDISPNSFGDNVYFSLSGPGVSVTAFGGTIYSWFGNGMPYAPGSTGGGNTLFYPDYVVSGSIGGNGAGNINLYGSCNLFAGTFTFPQSGNIFTVQVPASLSGITGTFLSTGQSFTLNTMPGTLTMTFTYSPQTGAWFPYQAVLTTIPEPRAFVLMATGLLAIFASVRRRCGV